MLTSERNSIVISLRMCFRMLAPLKIGLWLSTFAPWFLQLAGTAILLLGFSSMPDGSLRRQRSGIPWRGTFFLSKSLGPRDFLTNCWSRRKPTYQFLTLQLQYRCWSQKENRWVQFLNCRGWMRLMYFVFWKYLLIFRSILLIFVFCSAPTWDEFEQSEESFEETWRIRCTSRSAILCRDPSCWSLKGHVIRHYVLYIFVTLQNMTPRVLAPWGSNKCWERLGHFLNNIVEVASLRMAEVKPKKTDENWGRLLQLLALCTAFLTPGLLAMQPICPQPNSRDSWQLSGPYPSDVSGNHPSAMENHGKRTKEYSGGWNCIVFV